MDTFSLFKIAMLTLFAGAMFALTVIASNGFHILGFWSVIASTFQASPVTASLTLIAVVSSFAFVVLLILQEMPDDDDQEDACCGIDIEVLVKSGIFAD